MFTRSQHARSEMFSQLAKSVSLILWTGIIEKNNFGVA